MHLVVSSINCIPCPSQWLLSLWFFHQVLHIYPIFPHLVADLQRCKWAMSNRIDVHPHRHTHTERADWFSGTQQTLYRNLWPEVIIVSDTILHIAVWVFAKCFFKTSSEEHNFIIYSTVIYYPKQLKYQLQPKTS
jgi:hypothetical protein